MAADQGEVGRRRQAPRAPIKEGEFRNVTFRAGAKAYNKLVEAANMSGYSISEVAEKTIIASTSRPSRDTSQPKFPLSDEAMRIVDTIAHILNIYESDKSWTEHEHSRVAASFAIQSMLAKAMPVPPIFADHEGRDEAEIEQLQLAAQVGMSLGPILFAPADFVVSGPGGRDTPPQAADVERSQALAVKAAKIINSSKNE